jgi:hypothetical protein
MTDTRRPAWVDDDLFPFESRFVTIDGHTIHYVDEGSGPTLLFLHGNPTWSFVYRDVIRALRDEFRCVALDYPGFELSSPRPGYQCLPEEHTYVVTAFVDALGLSASPSWPTTGAAPSALPPSNSAPPRSTLITTPLDPIRRHRDDHPCSFSNFVSFRDALSSGDARRLTACHLAFVSYSCHFCQGTPERPLPRLCDPRARQRSSRRFRHGKDELDPARAARRFVGLESREAGSSSYAVSIGSNSSSRNAVVASTA